MMTPTWLLLISFILSSVLHCSDSRQTTVESYNKRYDNLFPPQNTSLIKTYLSICAVIKNEPDIREWIVYHHKMGVGTFYIHDSGDQYLLKDEVPDYIEKGIVHAVQGNFTKFPQFPFYQHCIKEYRNYHNWIAIIDADEFIVTKKQCSIPSILRYYEEYGGVALNWMMFGSSGHKKRPSGGLLSNYYKCYMSHLVKSISNAKYVVKVLSPHHFQHSQGKFCVDTDFMVYQGPHVHKPRSSLFEIMWVNHYHLKSAEDFLRSRIRGRADAPTAPSHKNDNYFVRLDRSCILNCSFVAMPLTYGVDCPKEVIFPQNSSVWF